VYAQTCKPVEELVGHSKNGFLSLRGDVIKREFLTSYKTSYRLPASNDCSVTETGTGISYGYSCQWKFEGNASEEFRAKYDALRSWVAACLPNATERDYASSTLDASKGKRFQMKSPDLAVYVTYRSLPRGMQVSLSVRK
jgi:hypothetical protein